ncbi:MAG: hypothetical protein HOO91_17010 [Bacteroidales bacterium]|nr:hypothetical protein [Bacteroidales bacterium]
MGKDKLDKINLGSLLISGLAFGLAIFSTWKSCSSENELKETNYKLTSIEYRPKLKFSNPEVIGIELSCDSLPIKKNLDFSDSIGNLPVKVKLSIKIKGANIGNHTAKIIGCFVADTLSEVPIIRQKLNEFNSFQRQHLYKDINPTDTFHTGIDYSPQFIINNKFCIHMLVLYENEIGQIYDTYYWIHYKANEIILPNIQVYGFTKKVMNIYKKELFRTVNFSGDNNYSTPYSEKEKNKIRNFLNQ